MAQFSVTVWYFMHGLKSAHPSNPQTHQDISTSMSPPSGCPPSLFQEVELYFELFCYGEVIRIIFGPPQARKKLTFLGVFKGKTLPNG